ncbi:MAG: CdiI immunity protein [Frankiales bacterium]|nr:CdiI immunity protein [Frankiales bacterium]
MSDKEAVRLKYRYLDGLMGFYFGEDWFDEYESDEAAAIADYLTHTQEVDRREALGELDRMRSEAESPDAFERDFAYLCWAYRPAGGPTPYREFADRLAAAISTSLERQP